MRPEIAIVAVADGAADNWTFLEGLEPESEVIDFWQRANIARHLAALANSGGGKLIGSGVVLELEMT